LDICYTTENPCALNLQKKPLPATSATLGTAEPSLATLLDKSWQLFRDVVPIRAILLCVLHHLEENENRLSGKAPKE